MKSMMRRPSDPLPTGLWKKISPYGDLISNKEASKFPVSELESPKLNMAGKLQTLLAEAKFSMLVAVNDITKKQGNENRSLLMLRDSIGRYSIHREIKEARAFLRCCLWLTFYILLSAWLTFVFKVLPMIDIFHFFIFLHQWNNIVGCYVSKGWKKT